MTVAWQADVTVWGAGGGLVLPACPCPRLPCPQPRQAPSRCAPAAPAESAARGSPAARWPAPCSPCSPCPCRGPRGGCRAGSARDCQPGYAPRDPPGGPPTCCADRSYRERTGAPPTETGNRQQGKSWVGPYGPCLLPTGLCAGALAGAHAFSCVGGGPGRLAPSFCGHRRTDVDAGTERGRRSGARGTTVPPNTPVERVAYPHG